MFLPLISNLFDESKDRESDSSIMSSIVFALSNVIPFKILISINTPFLTVDVLFVVNDFSIDSLLVYCSSNITEASVCCSVSCCEAEGAGGKLFLCRSLAGLLILLLLSNCET